MYLLLSRNNLAFKNKVIISLKNRVTFILWKEIFTIIFNDSFSLLTRRSEVIDIFSLSILARIYISNDIIKIIQMDNIQTNPNEIFARRISLSLIKMIFFANGKNLAITSSANYLFLSSVPLNISSQRFELIVSGLEQVQQHIPYPLTSQMIDTFKSELW